MESKSLEPESLEIVNRYAEPFARALAVFVRELRESEAVSDAQPGHPRSEPIQDDLLAAELMQAVEKNDAQEKAGNLVTYEVTEETASKAIAARLRYIIRERGYTQKKLAEKIGVTPARISHFLKNPNRSKVDTLRKIADALDIDLRDII